MSLDTCDKLTLVVVSPERVSVVNGKAFFLSQKTIEGGIEYAKRWPGNVKMLFDAGSRPQDSASMRKVVRDDVPFEIVVAPLNSTQIRSTIRSADVRVIALSSHLLHLASETDGARPRSVLVAENSLRTRWQMIKATTKNPAIRARRLIWEARQESRFRAAVRLSAGIQCNGSPTYARYCRVNHNALLFFDGRVPHGDMARESDLTRKFEERKGKPLHLAFSGRLISIKGVEDLLVVAKILKRAGVEFVLSICGEGPLDGKLRQMATEWQLEHNVVFRGYLDFSTELVPFLKREIDVFLCCHLQGDPSCTYLETMACGVPIVGYANEAFAGVWRESKGGWLCSLGRPKAMSSIVIELTRKREEIVRRGRDALSFAYEHSVQKTFDRRVSHYLSVVETHGAFFSK